MASPYFPRSALALSLALAATVLTTAAPGGEAPVTLTVWDWHVADTSKGPGKWLTDIDAAFQKQHPNVTIEHVAKSHNEYYQIFKAAASTRSGPDVVMLHQGARIVDNAESLHPLTDLVTPEFKQTLLGWDLTSEDFDASKTPYAVPVAVQGNVWYYNKKLLREAGIDPETPPQSWEAFLAACDAVKRIGKAGIAVGEKEGGWAGWFLNSACFQVLTPEDRERIRTGEMPWTDPKIAPLFERLKELGQRGCLQKGFMSTPMWPEAQYIFRRGDAAFFLGLISDVAHWKDFSETFGPENVGVMTCPVFQPGPDADRFPVGGAFAYAITSWCPVPKVAFDYIAFVTNAENARTFLSDVGSFPANQTIDYDLFTDPSAKQIASWLAAGRTGSQFTGKLPATVDDPIQRECQRLLAGVTDVESALAAIQHAATAEVVPTDPTPPWVLVVGALVLAALVTGVVLLLRRRRRSLGGRIMVGGRPAAKVAYLFLVPAVGLLLMFRLVPAVSALVHSFTQWDGVNAPTYVGLANYTRLFRDPVFWEALWHNLLLVLAVPLWVLASLVLALLIHQETFGWRFFRATYFLPSVLSPVIVGLLFFALLQYDGPVNEVLRRLGLGALAAEWLGDHRTVLPTLVLIILWGIFGHGVIVFLAGLSAVPDEIFEAARLDGATGWRFLWHIVIPSLRHVLEFWAVNLVVWSFTSLFAFLYVTTQGGPGYASMLVSYRIYKLAFEMKNQMGYACAMGTTLFLLIFGIILFQIRLMVGKEET